MTGSRRRQVAPSICELFATLCVCARISWLKYVWGSSYLVSSFVLYFHIGMRDQMKASEEVELAPLFKDTELNIPKYGEGGYNP